MLYEKLIDGRRARLRELASKIYEPDEIDAWMTMPQPMAAGLTPEQALENGNAYSQLEAGMQALIDGAYI